MRILTNKHWLKPNKKPNRSLRTVRVSGGLPKLITWSANTKTTKNKMQKEKVVVHRKRQDDRLLKRLSMKERRQQEELRRLIAGDPLFKTI
jgi:hypothetical protein